MSRKPYRAKPTLRRLRRTAKAALRWAKNFCQEAAMVAMVIFCPWTIKVDNENEEKD
jgi:hypothetical protein